MYGCAGRAGTGFESPRIVKAPTAYKRIGDRVYLTTGYEPYDEGAVRGNTDE